VESKRSVVIVRICPLVDVEAGFIILIKKISIFEVQQHIGDIIVYGLQLFVFVVCLFCGVCFVFHEDLHETLLIHLPSLLSR
jgi:hypothetical protein